MHLPYFSLHIDKKKGSETREARFHFLSSKKCAEVTTNLSDRMFVSEHF
jgi:hypothetical protein